MNRYALRPILIFALLGLTLPSTGATAETAPVLPPQAHPYGHTYGEWAAAWWTWALLQPVSTNPILDPDGTQCANNQEGKVWFLAGDFGGTVNRSCTVPLGTALLFPVVNTVFCAIPTDPPEEQTEEFVRSQVAFLREGASGLHATIDGISVPDIQGRYFEESALFEVTVPEDNLFNPPLPAGTLASPCADSGYYLMVPPLPPGEHIIKFSGSVPSQDFSLDVTYEITVSR